MKKNKKILIIVIICILIIGGGITAIVLLNNDNNKVEQKEEQKIDVLLNDSLDFEINSEVKLLSLVSEDNKAEIISEDEIIDTSSLGKKELVIKYKDKDEEKEHKFKINIVDTTKPTIEAESELSTTQGTEIDLLKNVKVKDNSKEEIKATIEGNYDFNNEGTYNLKYVAVDSSNNKVEKEFVLKVNKKKTNTSSNNNKNTSTNNNTSSNNNSSNTSNNNSSSSNSEEEYQRLLAERNALYNKYAGKLYTSKPNIQVSDSRIVPYISDCNFWYEVVNVIETPVANGVSVETIWEVKNDYPSNIGEPNSMIDNAFMSMYPMPDGDYSIGYKTQKIHLYYYTGAEIYY